MPNDEPQTIEEIEALLKFMGLDYQEISDVVDGKRRYEVHFFEVSRPEDLSFSEAVRRQRQIYKDSVAEADDSLEALLKAWRKYSELQRP